MAAKTEDFKVSEITKTVQGHAEDIKELEKRLEKIEEKFGDSVKIANTIYETSIEATKIQDMLATNLNKLFSHDEHTQKNIALIIEKTDRNQWKLFLGKSGAAGWIILTIIVDAVIRKFIG